MKKKERKILLEKTQSELENALKDGKNALQELSLEHVQGKLKNTSLLSAKRKEIALIKTKLTEKRLLEQVKGNNV